jgi:glycogen synthase
MRQAYAAFRRAVYALRWTLAAARTRPKRLLLVLLLVALLVSGIVRSLQRPPLIIRASLLSAAARERRSLLASHARALFPPPPAPPLPPFARSRPDLAFQLFPRAARRHIPPQAYQHLDFSVPISPVERPRRILHVTKEFGPATMGGLGVMLTALATAQAESPFLSIAVALPHYSYLSDRLPSSAFEPCANLSIPIADQSWYRRLLRHHRRTRTYRCPVTRLRWPLATGGGRNDSPLIDIFLLGPSDEKPFSVAFHAKNEGDIYSAYKPLKQEWKDLFFARAAAELVRHLANEQPVGRASTAAIDVVHLHGATNAMVGYFLRAESPSPSSSVAVVYTLHDSLDEVEYSNLIANVRPFLPLAETSVAQTDAEVLQPLHPYIYRSGTQLFTSALGVDLSDVTTFVSRSIASDIVGRRFRFHLEDLVMPSIAANAARGDFIGVTNALDFSDPTKNPFRSEQLIRAGVAFSETDLTPSDGAVDDKDPPRDEPPLTSAKTRARRLLVAALPELFSVEDLHRPWFLFIGRYQYNKGCQFFETLVDLLASSPTSGRLVLLGARNNYPFDELSRLAVRFPSHVTLIDDRTPAVSHIQREWGAVLRMASDIAFVPSLSEAFGLVAAEALLFGMPVLSTGVGGLREFLDPIPDGSDDDDSPSVPRTGNSYLFDLFPDRDTAATQGAEQDYSQSAEDVRPSEALLAPARAALRAQAEIALRDWSRRQEAPFASETEDFCRRLVSQALSLRWDRPGGPVEEVSRSESFTRWRLDRYRS